MAEVKRWPKRAEAMRAETRELAEVSVTNLRNALAEIRREPLKAELLIMATIADQERIWRLMELAKQGADQDESP